MPTESRSLRVRVPLIAALALLTLALFAPQAMARYVYTGNYEDDNVSVIDTATNQVVGSPIPAGDGPYSMAVAPNGKTLYVGNSNGVGDLTVIDTQTNKPTGSIVLGISTATIAISPDGTTAYVTASGEDLIVPVNLQTNTAGTPFPVGGVPWGVAFAPDGKTAWVTNEDDGRVSVIDTATRQLVGPPIPVGEEPINIVFSADGKTAYVNNLESNSISVIDTASRQVVATIPVGEEPWGLGLTPDGTKLYVSNYADDNVSVIDTATRQVVGSPIPTSDEPYELAITPDGKSVYVANYGTVDSVTVINTQTNGVNTILVPGGPWQVAIVPDQSPVAAFTATPSTKQPLNLAFNGAGSTDPDGTVARFDWNFGDGMTALNGGVSPSHTYKKAATYSASLTVFDNEGCSGFVFTGRTAYCNGNSTIVQSLNVKAPNNFKFGKLTRNAKKGTAKLKIKLPSPGKIALSDKKVKPVKRSAKQASTITINIRPKPKAKKQLAQTGSAKVRIKVKFTPTGGKAKTKGKTVKLIKN